MDPNLLASVHHYRLDEITFVLVAGFVGAWLLRQLGRRGATRRWLRFSQLALLATVVGGVLIADDNGREEQERLQAMLQGFAPTYAIGHEQLGYADISLDTPADDPTYLRLIEQQKQWLQANPSAHDIYTFQRDDQGQVVLVVDSETDYDHNGVYEGDREERTDIGEPYEIEDDDEVAVLNRAFTGEQIFDNNPAADRWGVWVSAYAPIRDPAGKVIAVLGVDYDASTWLRSIVARRIGTLVFFGAMLVLLLGSGAILLLDRERALRALLSVKNAELEVATAAAQTANQAKTAFLANMSHELRTPLTSILGFTELLSDPSHAADERRSFLDTIRRSGRHLLDVLSDILDLSKLEAGAVEFETIGCDATATARDVVQMLIEQARRKGLTLQVEGPPTLAVRADPIRLRQILVNLVGNAVKFTERGSVTLRLAPATGGQVTVRVVDTGPGLSTDQQGLLFQPFRQVDSSASRRHGGTGLGLAISRRLAQAMGGDITLRSEPGHGSTFELQLPAADQIAAVRSVDTAPASTRTAITGRVLLVEDGADNRRLLHHILRRAGLDVTMAENGRVAVDLLLGDGPKVAPAVDLVLMDMQMPELDGYEATQLLRASGFRRPIVAVTANALNGDRERCLAAGCDDFVSKPIDRAQLLATLERWLRERR